MFCFAGSITRRLFFNYTGPAIQVERNGGGTRDIPFVGRGAGVIDFACLADFSNGANLRVSKVYNQDPFGGGGTDMVQATYSKQANIWDGVTGPVLQNGLLSADFGSGTIYSATPGLSTGTSPALTFATVLKRSTSDVASVAAEIGHTTGAGDGKGWTPLIFDSASVSPANAYGSFEGAAHTLFTVADSRNLHAYVCAMSASANANALAMAQDFVALTGTPTGTKTLSLAANSWCFGCNHDSGGNEVLRLDAWANCWTLVKGVLSGAEAAALNRSLAQHLSV